MATELKDYESHYDRLEVHPECTKTEIRYTLTNICMKINILLWVPSIWFYSIAGKPGFDFPCNTTPTSIQMMKKQQTDSLKSKSHTQVSSGP